jgi:hypothetical protein
MGAIVIGEHHGTPLAHCDQAVAGACDRLHHAVQSLWRQDGRRIDHVDRWGSHQ